MDTESTIKEVQNITLAHMHMEIDVDRLLLDDYAGAEKELAILIVQGYYRRYLGKLGDDASPTYLKKALTHSKWFATKRLTQELPGLIERSTIYILDEAKRSGWFTDMEYDSITELLSSMYDPDDASQSEKSDYTFIIDTLIPAARKYGVDTDDVMGASVQAKKLRGMVTHARELLNRYENGAVDANETAQTLGWMFSKVADVSTSYTMMKDEFYEWEGKVRKIEEPLLGRQIVLGNNETWMLVPVSDSRDVTMIEQALKNRVKFRLTGMDWLLNTMNSMFSKTIGGGNGYHRLDTEFREELDRVRQIV